MQISANEIIELAAEFEIDPHKLTEYISSKSKRDNPKPWPMRLAWCQKDQEIQVLFRKYKYLSSLLNELRNHKAISKDRNHSLGVDSFDDRGSEKEYVLLDLSKSRKRIADCIGCSEETVGNYIRGLVRCGLMKTFCKGRKTYYSMGEWGVMPSDQDSTEFVPIKRMWLTEATSRKLKQFEPYRR